MKLANCDAVYVLADAVRPTIPKLALQFALPAVYQGDQFVDIGGSMSYGPEGAAMNFRAADYVDRIIKGGKSCRHARGATYNLPASGEASHGESTWASDPGVCGGAGGATLIPVVDAVIVLHHGGSRTVAFGVHGGTAVAMLIISGLLLID